MSDAHQLGPLLDRYRAGDRAALDLLMEGLRPYLRLLVRSRLDPGLGRRGDDSDLVQETLLRIHGGFQEFTGTEVPQFLGWVGRIVQNVVADFHRHHGRDKRDARREVAARLTDQPGGEDSPSARARRDEEAARLARALEALPPPHREVIEARFFDQLPFAQIARQTGKSEGALRVLCLRALDRLRQEMGTNP